MTAPRVPDQEQVCGLVAHLFRHHVGAMVSRLTRILGRGQPIWFGGIDRSEASMAMFYDFLGEDGTARIRLAVMDMWKAFRGATEAYAPQAAILYDKFHVLRQLNEAMDQVRKAEYKRLTNRADRTYIKGQKYVLLSHRENLSPAKRRGLRALLAANTRLNTAYVLKEQFGQLWEYQREPWARKFFDQWCAALRWQHSLAPGRRPEELATCGRILRPQFRRWARSADLTDRLRAKRVIGFDRND